MGKKTVDIDALVAKNSLELIIDGKTYTITDIPMNVFLEATNVLETDGATGTAVHRQLALMLGVEFDKISNVGLRTATVVLEQIREWMLPEEPEETEGSDETSDP